MEVSGLAVFGGLVIMFLHSEDLSPPRSPVKRLASIFQISDSFHAHFLTPSLADSAANDPAAPVRSARFHELPGVNIFAVIFMLAILA